MPKSQVITYPQIETLTFAFLNFSESRLYRGPMKNILHGYLDIINWPVIADFCNIRVAVHDNGLEPGAELEHVSLHVHVYNLKEK